MLHRVTLLAISAPRRVLAVAALLMVGAVIFGVPVAKTLSAGGFQDPNAESVRATELLTDKFGQGDVQLLFMVTAPDGVRGAGHREPDQGRAVRGGCGVAVDGAAAGCRRPDQQGRPIGFGRRGYFRR